jgi:hypothetical protein
VHVTPVRFVYAVVHLFICVVKRRKEDTVVPVLNDHCFHNLGIEVIDLASEKWGVHRVPSTTFPISHAAFDVVFLEPFKTY